MQLMRVTRESLTELISRGDAVAMHAIGRALVHLLNRQTSEEQRENVTKNHNDRGFTPADARQGSIHAKYYIRHKCLQPWQVTHWLRHNAKGIPRLSKYWAQLDQEAQKRAAARAQQQQPQLIE
jgi:hypothetical protein